MKLKGVYGWIILIIFVWQWDSRAPESLSRAFWNGLESPRKRPFVVFALMWTVSHLLFKKPRYILIWW